MDNIEILFKKTQTDAIVPKKEIITSVGYVLSSCENKKINPDNNINFINTGINIFIPKGYYGRVISILDNNISKNISVVEDNIISDQSGVNIHIMVKNMSNKPINIEKNQNLAQIIIEKITPTTIREIDRNSSDFSLSYFENDENIIYNNTNTLNHKKHIFLKNKYLKNCKYIKNCKIRLIFLGLIIIIVIVICSIIIISLI